MADTLSPNRSPACIGLVQTGTEVMGNLWALPRREFVKGAGFVLWIEAYAGRDRGAGMHPDLEKLIVLQRHDVEAKRLREALVALPKRMAELAAKFEALKGQRAVVLNLLQK